MISRNEKPLRNPELVDNFVAKLAETFIHHKDRYPIQLQNGTYITVKQSLSPALLLNHIRGKITLGAYALDINSQAQWICIDADTDEQWYKLHKLTFDLTQSNIPVYRELSRRGGHLWLFTPKIAGSVARQFAKQLLAEHQIEDVEIYPKQDKLKTGPGSLVRLPFGIHRKSGKRYYFIQLNNTPLTSSIRQQIALLSNPQRVPVDYIEHTLAQISEPVPSPPLQLPKVPAGNEKYLSERIKNAITVKDFVRHYIELNERNIGLCPFHADEQASFGVNEVGNYWHCFAGCGGGSVVDFWMKWRNKHGRDGSFTATITELAQILFGS